MMKNFLFCLLLSAIFVGSVSYETPIYASSEDASQESISFKKAWIRPGQKGQTTAAYGVFVNTSEKDLVLVKASSDVCQEVQLHETVQEERQDGVQIMKMRQKKAFVIPAKSDLALKPGGHHMMLIGLHETLEDQQEKKISLHLTFEGGKHITLTLPVRRQGPPCGCSKM